MTNAEGGHARKIPLLPVRDLVLFPGVIVPLFVGRPRSLKALEEAMLHDKTVLVVAQRDMTVEDPEPEDIFETGTVTTVLQMLRLPDGTTKVLVEGMSRASVLDVEIERDTYFARVETVETPQPQKGSEVEALRRTLLAQFDRYVTLHPKIPLEVLMSVTAVEDPGQVSDLVASHLTVRIQERQQLLETWDVPKRLEMIIRILLREIELLEMERSIHDRVRQELEKGQKEYYLREQLKVIQDELGQGDEFSEIDNIREAISRSRMPEEVRKKALHELDRLAKMPSMSAEATVVRTYLDWMTNLPWGKRTRERMDVSLAEKVLNEDHYALEEAKERILEYLAVRKHARGRLKGQVLCFAGPPGVGKTSLGRSIARATGRKFVNMSLGGIRDEAEIRGHRRTYIGALPGRIIQKLRQAGTCNPVMLLDEIDKIGLQRLYGPLPGGSLRPWERPLHHHGQYYPYYPQAPVGPYGGHPTSRLRYGGKATDSQETPYTQGPLRTWPQGGADHFHPSLCQKDHFRVYARGRGKGARKTDLQDCQKDHPQDRRIGRDVPRVKRKEEDF